MKTNNSTLKVRALTLAVQAALLAMCAMPARADDAEAEALALKTPTNYVEIGASNTSRSAALFGAYNGLNKSGVAAVGDFSVRGGNAYGDGNGAMRWSISGTDLGLSSRSLEASVSDQGQWSLSIGYDELRHNFTDSYQTPYQGSAGGNSFVLPTGFGTTANTVTSLSAGQQAAFHTVDIGTSRKNTSFSAGYIFNRQWDFKVEYNHLDQSGSKLMGFGSASNGSVSGEFVSILPNPTNYTTDTVNLALNWMGDKGHLSGSYFGSFFQEGYDRVSFQTFAGANSIQTLSTAPSNDFHQLNLSGGYAFSPKTHLSGGFSYGRNTQNDSFVVDPFLLVSAAPKSSLDGLVVTTHGDVKLSDRSFKDLTLTAGIKYDERDNRTAAALYNFNAIDGGHTANYSNTPLSNRKTQVELAGDYRLAKNQSIRLAYNLEDVKRKCGQYAGNASSGTLYGAGGNCVVATASQDNKLGATYKLKASDDVDLNAGYSYSRRKTDSDPNAIAAFITTKVPGGVFGQNAGDFLGFYPYFSASRNEQKLKAGANWQAHEKLSLGLNAQYTDDDYFDSTYGVLKGNSWSLNLDATYSYSDNGVASAYLSQEHRQRDLTDQQNAAAITANGTRISVPANSSWTNKLEDDDITVGLGVKHRQLLGGKLELAGDLTYSFGKTAYGTQLNYFGATTGGLTCSDPSILSCGQLPDIKNRLTQLKLSGAYQVDKHSKIAVRYIYQQLKSTDFFYNAYQTGFTPTQVLPTNQQPGSYSVNVIAVSYSYSFK